MISKFELGQVVSTPSALAAMEASGNAPLEYLRRHQTGDWGELDPEDQESNNEAVIDSQRILSAYRLSDGTKIWIITEWDRSVTTILLPEEY